MHMKKHTHTHVDMSTHVLTTAYAHTHVHTHVHTHMHTHTCTLTHAHSHMHTHINTHTHMHMWCASVDGQKESEQNALSIHHVPYLHYASLQTELCVDLIPPPLPCLQPESKDGEGRREGGGGGGHCQIWLLG